MPRGRRPRMGRCFGIPRCVWPRGGPLAPIALDGPGLRRVLALHGRAASLWGRVGHVAPWQTVSVEVEFEVEVSEEVTESDAAVIRE